MSRQFLQYHPVIGHKFVPGIRARVSHEGGGYLMTTNAAGFRCRHQFVSAKSPGSVRALLFGDSFTAGDGLSDRDRFGDVLETLLPTLEVYNFGLPGTGTDQHYLAYREMAQSIAHDVLIIAVFVENIRRVVARYRPFLTSEGHEMLFAKPYFSIGPEGSLELHQVSRESRPVEISSLDRTEMGHVDQVAGGGARRLVDSLGVGMKERLQRLTRHQPFPAYDRPDDPAWLLLKTILSQWIAESPVPTILLLIPFYRHIEGTASPTSYLARFQELHDPPTTVVQDPLPMFLRYSPEVRRQFRFPTDPHMTPAAHKILAQSLTHCLRTVVPELGG